VSPIKVSKYSHDSQGRFSISFVINDQNHDGKEITES